MQGSSCSYVGGSDQAGEVTQILKTDLQVRHRVRRDEFLVHIGLKGQALHIDIVAKRHEAFAPVVTFVIGVLHRAQHFEDVLVLFHEGLARQGEVSGLAGFQHRPGRFGRASSAEHRVVNAFAR